MEVNEIVYHIFGREIAAARICERDLSASALLKKSKCLECVHHWVNRVMEEMEPLQNKQVWPVDTRDGRLGPAKVCLDTTSHVGLFVFGEDQLSVMSQSNFSTIRANACLYRGKWQYEVQLGSEGVMQIGWATSVCKFSQEIGVGDTVNSYAYDGNRVRKWNVSTHKYGEVWRIGDIIGCTIDLDSGVLEFYRNGRCMGEAFDSVQMGPGMAYFPAVSLAFSENLVANFGSTPMRYPVPGFQSIQAAPFRNVAKAEQLCKWLSQLLMLFDHKYEMLGQEVSQPEEPITNQTLLMGLARIFLHPLAPLLLSSYITDACLVPFLESLCNLSSVSGCSKNKTPSGKKRRFMLFLDMLWAFLEEHELKRCLECVVSCLLARFQHMSFALDYAHQKQSLLLLTYLVHHPRTRQHLLENVLFDKMRFANFVHVKPLYEGGLAEVVSHAWWESNGADQRVEENKAAYFTACHKIKEAIASVETLQVELLRTLLDNSDGTSTQASSRKIFLRKFRAFLYENLMSSRTLPFLQIPLPVTLCCFHRLLVTFRALWEREVREYPIVIPARTFYDGSVNYYSTDRLGGVLSHLNKTLKADLVGVLGADHPVITTMQSSENQNRDLSSEASAVFISDPSVSVRAEFTVTDGRANLMIPVLARVLTQQPSSSPLLGERVSRGQFQEQKAKGGCLDAAASLIELLDGLVLFYHVSAHKQLAKVSTLRDSMGKYVTALDGVTVRLETYRHMSPNMSVEENSAEIIRELERTSDVFKQKLSEEARYMAWVRAAVFSADKQSHLAWLLRVILQTVKLASKEGQLFAYVPDFYLDSLVEICAALRTYMHPTAPLENIEGYEDLLIEVSEFLCDHFSDPRIVHANSKDTLIQALASFVCSPNTLLALERVPCASRTNMVRALLRPYENRAWAQSNWVLVRIWQGCGFAFRYHKSPHLLRKLGPKLLQADSSLISQSIKPCPSRLFQGHVKEIMMSDEALTTAFLNSLLNQLNWAFSEFIGMLQEIQNASSLPERVFIESRQLKICATCFDLALALLRVLEMVVSTAPEVFTEVTRSSSELLLSRLCQLLCQVLNRVSSQVGCFQHVVMLDIPDLETVNHFPILAAVVGILLAVLHDEIQKFDVKVSKVPEVTKALLTEPSFQLESLNFVLGDLQKGSKLQKMKPFSFYNYSDDVSFAEIEDVKNMIRLLSFYQGRLSDVKTLSEDELCTICYAYPISATFRPCNHLSCRTCIAHHLMNSRDCFFCKAPIQFVIGLDDKVLHDLSKL